MGVRRNLQPKHSSEDAQSGAFSNLNELDAALRLSFSGIREDLEEVRNDIMFQVNAVKVLHKELEDTRKDYVGVEKLNSLKIKIGDMNEELKRLDRIEKSLNELSEEIVSRVEGLEKTSSRKSAVLGEIDDLKEEVEQLKSSGKTAVTQAVITKFSKEVSAELNQMLRKLSEFEKEGGEITSGAISKFRAEIDNKLEAANVMVQAKALELAEQSGQRNTELLEHVREVMKNFKTSVSSRIIGIDAKIEDCRTASSGLVTKQQINRLIADVNKEFDTVKEDIENVQLLERDIKQLTKEKIARSSYEKSMSETNSKIENLQNEVESLTSQVSRERALRTAAEKSLYELGGRVDKLRNQMAALNINLTNSKKEIKGKTIALDVRPKGPGFIRRAFSGISMYHIASLFLALSFALIACGFGAWYLERADIMRYFVYAAVGSFAAGLVLRVTAVIREG